MIKLNVKEIINLFDVKSDDVRYDITSVIGVVGEDLGAALFKCYYEEKSGKKVTVSPSTVLSKRNPDGTKKGPRLDRWIYVQHSKNKSTAYQTEIKNWSAYAIKARKVGMDNKTIPAVGLLNWKDRIKRLQEREKNGENKVFYPMKKPADLPNKATIEPLIIYWSVLSKDGRNLDPYFRATMPIKGFKKLNVFSMSNYLRSIKKKELTLDMPGAEKRIRHLKKYFPSIA
ncbi:MAG: hypothetical protein UT20_C0024G0011 [Candidatus Levybacteria bacterium GW2011_GWA1_39_11]|uniref:Uncharacterized protein n=1 Tax=Candidatus Giovannonibacteria bacterium GW2011_GWA2_45_21 TaxID=1618649 RepID=A0A0G1MB10_9BACT|nr:MAG: hypothetical protein UT20_C0024G0011 [Candidatus Levybacteria bacterium GW2011_GWA1_39_11]KKU05257.1 MAG: hypothetical protein UX06_C0001G0018 [Candidatus Giovannonibacteria bacterium GW2011_GWA2_45_21]